MPLKISKKSLYIITYLNLFLFTGVLVFFYYMVPFGDSPPIVETFSFEAREWVSRLWLFAWFIFTPFAFRLWMKNRNEIKNICFIVNALAFVPWCLFTLLLVLAFLNILFAQGVNLIK